MSVETLEIVEPGLLTTVQDTGRYGYQRLGVPVSGAMDLFALRAANILVGNDERAAGLEITVLGPKVRFLAETWIALTGADLDPHLDGEPVPTWRSVRIPKDGVLSFRGVRDGVRSYLAIAGGIDVPLVMGSRSTYLQSGIGGLEGRALRAADTLCAMDQGAAPEFAERKLPEHLVAPTYGHHHVIRVVLGPQDSAFTSEGLATFLGSTCSVSIQSDRAGYQLDGPPIEHKSGPDIVSDGTPLGAVQVPGDGHPIILLADRGTTGGYAKIATVISSDIDELGQAMPGDTLTFKAVTVEEAHVILRQREALLDDIRKGARAGSVGKLSIVVDGEEIEAVDESGQVIALSDPGAQGDSGATHHARATVDGRTFEFDVNVRGVD